jgi:hypothetical protein
MTLGNTSRKHEVEISLLLQFLLSNLPSRKKQKAKYPLERPLVKEEEKKERERSRGSIKTHSRTKEVPSQRALNSCDLKKERGEGEWEQKGPFIGAFPQPKHANTLTKLTKWW